MPDTTPETQDQDTDIAKLTVDEIAGLESGTTGALGPRLARLDIIVTALICVGGAVLAYIMPDLVTSGGITIGRNYATMSPSMIPRLVFGVLAVVAAFAMVAAFARYRNIDTENPADEADRYIRAALIAIVVLFYALTVTWLGFILSTMIVSLITAYFLGLRNPLAFVPGVLIIPIVIRFIFERLLLIALPRSRIESVGQIEDQVLGSLANVLIQ